MIKKEGREYNRYLMPVLSGMNFKRLSCLCKISRAILPFSTLDKKDRDDKPHNYAECRLFFCFENVVWKS